MTVSSTTRSVRYTGNGVATEFDFDFPIPTGAPRVVIETISTGARTILLSSQYGISGLDDVNGGTVTYPLSGTPLAATHAIIIYREVPFTQTLDITTEGGFYPPAVEGQLDSIVYQVQQVNEAQTRTLTAPIGETVDSYELPAAAVRAGKVLAFDGSGKPALSAQEVSTFEVGYDTAASVGGVTVDAGVNWLFIAGHTTVGDGLGGLFNRGGSGPADNDNFQSGDGAWWTRSKLDVSTFEVVATILSFLQSANATAAVAAINAPGLALTNIFTAGQTIRLADNGSASGPRLSLDRNSASPAALDALGEVAFDGRDNVGQQTTFGIVYGAIGVPTDGLITGIIRFRTPVAATYGDRFEISHGLYASSLTDKGAGTVNAVNFYQNGNLNAGRVVANVAFNGTGTPAIKNQQNVTSITDNGTGDFTINFTTAEPDTLYTVLATAGTIGTSTQFVAMVHTKSAGSVRIICRNASAVVDPDDVNVLVIR